MLKVELEETDPQLWLAAQFMFYCFIRPKELRFMKIKHLDLFEGRITLYADITKPNKTRIVDIQKTFLNKLISQYKLHKYNEEDYVFTILKEPGETPVGKNYFGVGSMMQEKD